MSRTSSRRASNAANRAINRSRGLHAASWFYGQSFHSTPVPSEPQSLTQCASCRRVVFTLVEGLCFACHGRKRDDDLNQELIEAGYKGLVAGIADSITKR